MTLTSRQEIAIPSFLGRSKGLLIDGRWTPALSRQKIAAINPATGETITHIAAGEAADVDLAVRAARRAFEGPWSRSTPYDRQRLLMRVHDVIESHFDELALIETLDMGAPLSRTRQMKIWASQSIMFYASQTACNGAETHDNSIPGRILTMSFKAPIGVIGGITAWNGPLVGLWWLVGATLATGCTLVLKPAEDASLSVLRVAELLCEAGVPDGVINVVTGFGSTAGAALAGHDDVDRIAFTGSVETGRRIVSASVSNLKRIQLELGGKSPDVVFADADLDQAVPGAAMGVFGNAGQICTAGTRVFVQRSIQSEFVERANAFAQGLKVGNGLDSGVQIGPLISQKQLDRVLGYVKIGSEEGARLASGGRRLLGPLQSGYFVEPTVFDQVQNDMTIAREEIFGPVMSVIGFDDEDEALRLANATPFGLAGGVWTRNASTAMRMAQGIKSGTVFVNCYGPRDPSVGYGGYKLSGYGWKGGPDHVDSFLYKKAVYMNIA
jgi:aldehyde dehydrogenase (NAD+)